MTAVPILLTTIPDAVFPIFAASDHVAPAAAANVNVEINVSPAPVTSNTSCATVGTRSCLSVNIDNPSSLLVKSKHSSSNSSFAFIILSIKSCSFENLESPK